MSVRWLMVAIFLLAVIAVSSNVVVSAYGPVAKCYGFRIGGIGVIFVIGAKD